MPRITEQVLIQHRASDLFDLVKDVRTYPKFIKWIERLEVSHERAEPQHYHCLGDVTVRFKGFQERFSTFVDAHPLSQRIDVRLHRGPFRRLRNRWLFEERGAGVTRVHFYLDYAFENPALRLLAKTSSRVAAIKIIEAFSKEADRRYAAPPVQDI
ncbi:MAG: SRPBCC family protein [Pseudomonadota bacterium]